MTSHDRNGAGMTTEMKTIPMQRSKNEYTLESPADNRIEITLNDEKSGRTFEFSLSGPNVTLDPVNRNVFERMAILGTQWIDQQSENGKGT